MADIVDRLPPTNTEDLVHLVHNPMFIDLQATLASECGMQSVPYMLVQGHSSKAKAISDHSNTDLLVEEATLQAEFRQLAPLKNPRVAELENFYNTQSATILTHRTDALHCLEKRPLSAEQLEKEKQAINIYYDEQQGHLTVRVSKSLQLLKCTLPSEQAQPGGATKRNKSRLLSARAVSIMSSWYDSNLDNPYPTDEQKQDMADEGNVSLSQVKAWFANKRNRSLNTKPKREKHRLQQQFLKIQDQLKSANSHLQGETFYNDIGMNHQMAPLYSHFTAGHQGPVIKSEINFDLQGSAHCNKMDANQNYTAIMGNIFSYADMHPWDVKNSTVDLSNILPEVR